MSAESVEMNSGLQRPPTGKALLSLNLQMNKQKGCGKKALERTRAESILPSLYILKLFDTNMKYMYVHI